MDLFIVNLNEAASNEVSLACLILGDGDDLAEGTRDDSFAFLALVATHHRMRLSAAGLPIGENCSIVPVDYAIDQREGTLLVNQTLSAVGGKDIIKREAFRLLFGILLDEIDLVVL